VRPLFFALAAAAALTSSPALAGYSGGYPSTYICDSGDTLARGQQRIDQGLYQEAIEVFSCVIAADPASVDGYRGRIEAKLLLGRFSDAVRDYARVTAFVLPVHPDAEATILAGYQTRLNANAWSVTALTGASFARWWFFDYQGATSLFNRLLQVRPNDVYGNLFRGSNRLFAGQSTSAGEADLTRALQLAPNSAHVRYIVADAYTYALPNPSRALSEATLALSWGLDTPRVHAILASAEDAMGDDLAAAYHLEQHIDLVTTSTIAAASLVAGDEETLDLVPGRTYDFPVPAIAGQTLSIATNDPSGVIWDSILVLLAPDGTAIVGSDDYVDYFAGLDWVAPQTGTYHLLVTSFESVGTGTLVVTRN